MGRCGSGQCFVDYSTAKQASLKTVAVQPDFLNRHGGARGDNVIGDAGKLVLSRLNVPGSAKLQGIAADRRQQRRSRNLARGVFGSPAASFRVICKIRNLQVSEYAPR